MENGNLKVKGALVSAEDPGGRKRNMEQKTGASGDFPTGARFRI